MTTIAIVDDDPGLRRALARLLSTFDFHTETFESAAEFLLAVETSKLACIIVDINLGSTSGLELVRQLHTRGLEFPVVFISGVEDETVTRRAIELGCIAFLRKPFAAHLLIEAIEKATDKRSITDKGRASEHYVR